MGGGITIGELMVDRCEAIKAEIEFRAIKYSKQYSRLSNQKKKDLLRKDEAQRLVDEIKGRVGTKPSDLKVHLPAVRRKETTGQNTT